MPVNSDIIRDLGHFKVANLLRNALLELKSSKKIIPKELEDLKKMIADRDLKNPWAKEEIEGVMKVFYDHESLFDENGRKRESLAFDSRFVQYLSNRHDIDQATLKSGLLQVAQLLCEASIAAVDRREAFFAGFPPEDLACLGGNNSRSEEDIRALRAEGLNGLIFNAYDTIRAQMVERVKKFDHDGNQEHIRRYLEYLLSLQTEEEVLKLDNTGFLAAKTIPASVAYGILSDFPELFKAKLIEELAKDVASRFEDIYSKVINEVNQDPEIDGSQLPESLGEMPESQFFGISERPNFRYASVVAKLGERLKLDNVTEFFDEVEEKDAEFSSEDQSSQKTHYKINREKIRAVLLEGQYAELEQKLGREKRSADEDFTAKASGPVKKRRVSVAGAVTRLEAASQEVGDAGAAAAAMDVEGKASDVADEIERLLDSGDKSDNIKAIEMLYVLSNPSLGCAFIQFFDILSQNDDKIYKKLDIIAMQKELPENYLEKITNDGKEGKRDGILERYAQYQGLKEATLVNDPENIGFTNFAIALFGGAKESSEKIIKIVQSIDRILKEYEFNVSGYKISSYNQTLNHFIYRNDILQILQNIIVEINKGGFSEDLNKALDEFMVDMLKKAIEYKLNDVAGVVAKHLGKEKLEDPELYRYGFLHLAIRQGNLGALEILQESGMDLDKRQDNRTALYFAVESKNKGAVRALLDLGVDVNIPGPSGQTPIYKAASMGNEEIFDILLGSAELDINKKTRDGDTVISIAISGYRVNEDYDKSVLYKLIDLDDIDLNVVNYLGQTPLHMSCELDDCDIMGRLVEKGVDLDLQDNNGQAALHLVVLKAFKVGYGLANFKVIEDGVKILIDAGVDLSKKNSDGQTAFDIISKAGAIGKRDIDCKDRIMGMLKVRSVEAQSSEKSTQSLPDGWDRGDGAGPADPSPGSPAGRSLRKRWAGQGAGQ